jgi:hypothetical protein
MRNSFSEAENENEKERRINLFYLNAETSFK